MCQRQELPQTQLRCRSSRSSAASAAAAVASETEMREKSQICIIIPLLFFHPSTQDSVTMVPEINIPALSSQPYSNINTHSPQTHHSPSLFSLFKIFTF